MSADLFQRMFRLSRPAFMWLLALITPKIDQKPGVLHDDPYLHSKFITPKTRLCITLRWLAGGSYLDICFAFGISIGSFYKHDGVLWGTIAAIDDVLEIGTL